MLLSQIRPLGGISYLTPQRTLALQGENHRSTEDAQFFPFEASEEQSVSEGKYQTKRNKHCGSLGIADLAALFTPPYNRAAV